VPLPARSNPHRARKTYIKMVLHRPVEPAPFLGTWPIFAYHVGDAKAKAFPIHNRIVRLFERVSKVPHLCGIGTTWSSEGATRCVTFRGVIAAHGFFERLVRGSWQVRCYRRRERRMIRETEQREILVKGNSHFFGAEDKREETGWFFGGAT